MNVHEFGNKELELQQDEWSLSSPCFGKTGQLQVVGWIKWESLHRVYVLKCSICAKDQGLFKSGYFRSLKSNLVTSGQVPCGCAFNPKWSIEQQLVRCERAAYKLGYTFLGFVGEWAYNRTKIRMTCNIHGEWSTGDIRNLVNKGNGCRKCAVEYAARIATKPDEVMIASFFASGAFHPDTKFWRSDRKNSGGWKTYWFLSCPECGEQGESSSGNLQFGRRPCGCSKHRQQECYINLVMEGDDAVAIKFGIAGNSIKRVKQQNAMTSFDVVNFAVYNFPTVYSCKRSEISCKEQLECGILSRQDMPDGWSETTWPYNLDKIIEIYERNGGVKIE